MEGHDICLVLSDIDGTILPYGEAHVPPQVRDAFRHAMAAGIYAGPATGRGYHWLEPLFAGEQECYRTCVATNGNQVMLDGRVLREGRFEGQVLAGVVEVARRFPHAGVIAFDGMVPTLVSGSIDELLACFPSYGKICRVSASGGALGLPEFPALKANVFLAEEQDGGFVPAPVEKTKGLVEALSQEIDNLDFDCPQPGFCNVMHVGWNKASGILALVDALGIGPENVVVFGDAGNDVTMFDAIPNSVAVANATPEAAAAARWHIGSCKDGAVGQAIESLAAGEWPFTE